MKHYLLALALSATAAHAEFWDGNKLHHRLNSEESMDRMMALGYIAGVSDTMTSINHCPAKNVTLGQMRDIVKNYVENLPAIRHRTADTLVLDALKIAFPCPANSNNRNGRNL